MSKGERKKAPASRGHGEAGSIRLDHDDTDDPLAVKSMEHAVETDRIERWLLSAGFWSPAALCTEMASHGLTCASFMGPFHREVAAALLGYASIDRQPTIESLQVVTTELGWAARSSNRRARSAARPSSTFVPTAEGRCTIATGLRIRVRAGGEAIR